MVQEMEQQMKEIPHKHNVRQEADRNWEMPNGSQDDMVDNDQGKMKQKVQHGTKMKMRYEQDVHWKSASGWGQTSQ